MRQRTVAPVAALLFAAGCAAGMSRESPSPSMMPSLEATTPSPETSAAPTAGGSVAVVTIFKVWDADGDANTTNDRESFAVSDFPPDAYPLEFELDVEAAGGAEAQVSTVPPEGTEQTVFQIESEDESVTATVIEIRKDDSVLIGGHCFDADTQEIVMGMTGGDAVSLKLPIGSRVGCTFINTPVPDLGVD